MSVWLAKPIYEFLPYLYMLVGAVLVGSSWIVHTSSWPMTLLIVGCIALLAGLVIWLRRRDYRTTQAQYNSHSLDE
jgi:hypothetical protein